MTTSTSGWQTGSPFFERERIRTLLEQSASGCHVRTANFAAGLLEEYDAL